MDDRGDRGREAISQLNSCWLKKWLENLGKTRLDRIAFRSYIPCENAVFRRLCDWFCYNQYAKL